jgi:hypothetical protein
MLFLYNLPVWLMAVCIVGTVVVLAYPGYFLIRLPGGGRSPTSRRTCRWPS